ncbi:unnamed protein product [Lupinus luteus]|uniref:Uncharacterized protein n=1 Tax=Lupinus luteus TaxID=3873 RepID=A0AAV1YG07_LUPLU
MAAMTATCLLVIASNLYNLNLCAISDEFSQIFETDPKTLTIMGNFEKLLNQIMELKSTSKSLQQQTRKCDEDEKSEKLKVKKAIEKGNMDGARIYVENAIRKRFIS